MKEKIERNISSRKGSYPCQESNALSGYNTWDNKFVLEGKTKNGDQFHSIGENILELNI